MPLAEMVTEAFDHLDHVHCQLQLQVGANRQQLMADQSHRVNCCHQLMVLHELFKLGELTLNLDQTLNLTTKR